ncbi:hypothetical protein HALLA_20240 (plasmid) [Halostagnicola larsenii XH-48]|uniref:Uncharacterized protein n=1 Tax=Halostagnicola larsenii XH-48 TaxID=797299 RepID=W0JZ15_9EURY|nr:hypothetical protein HALLA_20240 [Halostagnicola larsenii XH-48]
MFFHLYTAECGTFYAIVLITAAVVADELLYFEREILEEGFRTSAATLRLLATKCRRAPGHEASTVRSNS